MVREMRFSLVRQGAHTLHEVMYFHSRFLSVLFSAQLLRQGIDGALSVQRAKFREHDARAGRELLGWGTSFASR
jgi:hypothetical protein